MQPRSYPVRQMAEFKRKARQEAYERRYKARQLLFGKGGGHSKNLPVHDRRFVQQVKEEAYQAYLHTFRTGDDTRYPGAWRRRRQRMDISKRADPMTRNQYWRVWYGSQKARYFRFDIRKKLEARLAEE